MSYLPDRDKRLPRAAAGAAAPLFIYYNLLTIMFNDFVFEPVSGLSKASGAERCQQRDRRQQQIVKLIIDCCDYPINV